MTLTKWQWDRAGRMSVNQMLTEVEEDIDVGSFNHAITQANLTRLLGNLGKYSVCTELSLDIHQTDISQFDLEHKTEARPDVCVYPKRGKSTPKDILKMTEMPLLAVEVLSPKQGHYTILEKFRLYFQLGIQSCWLVLPEIDVVTVYSSINHYQTFTQRDNEVIDDILNIRLPIAEIFS
jgi:Uma2 family endonuclease